jgi:hypothetical protein
MDFLILDWDDGAVDYDSRLFFDELRSDEDGDEDDERLDVDPCQCSDPECPCTGIKRSGPI